MVIFLIKIFTLIDYVNIVVRLSFTIIMFFFFAIFAYIFVFTFPILSSIWTIIINIFYLEHFFFWRAHCEVFWHVLCPTLMNLLGSISLMNFFSFLISVWWFFFSHCWTTVLIFTHLRHQSPWWIKVSFCFHWFRILVLTLFSD